MIKDKKTTIGYHCPACGLSIINKIDIFSMGDSLLKLKCYHNDSELLIQITRDKKIRLTVPCLVCPTPHTYMLNSDAFFTRDLFALTCTYTAINICFFGQGAKVIEEMKKNEEELMKLFSAYEEDIDDDTYSSGYVLERQEDEKYTSNPELFPDDEIFDDEEYDEDGDYEDCEYEDENTEDDELTDEEAISLIESVYINDKSGKLTEEQKLEYYKNFIKYEAENKAAKEREFTMRKQGAQKPSVNTAQFKAPQVTEAVLTIAAQMVRDGKVRCACEEIKPKINAIYDRIQIECTECGAKRDIRCEKLADIEYLDGMDILFLDD